MTHLKSTSKGILNKIFRYYIQSECRRYLKLLVQFYIKFSIIYPSYCLLEGSRILYNNIFEKERFINKTIILARKNTLNTTVENILKDNNLSFEKNNFNKDLLKYNDIGNGHISLERKSVKSEAEIQLAKKLKVIDHQDNSIEEVEKLIKIINYNENLYDQKKIYKKPNSVPINTFELIRIVPHS